MIGSVCDHFSRDYAILTSPTRMKQLSMATGVQLIWMAHAIGTYRTAEFGGVYLMSLVLVAFTSSDVI